MIAMGYYDFCRQFNKNPLEDINKIAYQAYYNETQKLEHERLRKRNRTEIQADHNQESEDLPF